MNYITYIYILHALIIAPLFIYIGIKKNETNKLLLKSLLYLGIVVVLYHMYKFYGYYKNGFIYHVNIYHILFTGPLLIYMGYRAENVEPSYYDLLLILGLGLLGYFSYKIYETLNNE